VLAIGTLERSADTVPTLTRRIRLNATPKAPSAFLSFGEKLTVRTHMLPQKRNPSITVVIFCWRILLISESMGHHDSEIMDDRSID
jgi:hypothetical protein